MKKTVVSFADGAGNYLKSMTRLEHSLKQTGFDGEFKGYNDYGHIRSPKHSETPYAFKPYSITTAIKEGAELLLWCDSPVYAIGDINPVFKHIKEKGHLFFNNIGYTVGDYTSDKCLEYFGITREESFKIPMIMACVMGLNMATENANLFLSKYNNAISVYPGAWTNVNQEVSTDLRCHGHRHDQSVASIIIHQMGLDILTGNETFFMYMDHIKVMPKAKSVCLLSQGM